ncbi:VIRMA [Lepeophtheirus salmonis]|uniref:VIRMA n=1 Tax=Lepeophtheirus salmonis TaxID=72036 RepID=A0A7R8D468_LEPSM|nr:VIRMA [Lepeophtheirus salmonis]CAF2970973.1 VIRMA [Lepeophtheirus salmonis]
MARSTWERRRRSPRTALVLRGLYTAITLAVYGTFSKSTPEQLALQGSTSENPVNGNANPPPPPPQQLHPSPPPTSPGSDSHNSKPRKAGITSQTFNIPKTLISPTKHGEYA